MLLLYYLIYQLHITFRGLTQVEDNFDYETKYSNYYDELKRNASLYSNFTNVFGKNPLLWLIPIAVKFTEKDGYQFLSLKREID